MSDYVRSPWVFRTLDAVDLAVQWIVIIAMLGMTSVVVLQVPLRFLGSSILFADEFARLCFVWAVFLAMPLGIKLKRQVVVEMLVGNLPARFAAPLSRTVAFLSAIIMAIVGIQAARVMINNWDEMLSTIQMTAASFYVPIVLGSLLSMLHLLAGAATKGAVQVEPSAGDQIS